MRFFEVAEGQGFDLKFNLLIYNNNLLNSLSNYPNLCPLKLTLEGVSFFEPLTITDPSYCVTLLPYTDFSYRRWPLLPIPPLPRHRRCL